MVENLARSVPFFNYPHVFQSQESEAVSTMLDVCRRGAFIMQKELPEELNKLFRVGTESSLITVLKRALVPPIGRFLSRWLPGLYFVVSVLFPFVVGQVTYVFIKRPNVAS